MGSKPPCTRSLQTKMEGKVKNLRGENFKEFTTAMTLGAALSCVVLSLIIFFTKGVPDVGRLAVACTNCTTTRVGETTVAECSFDCAGSVHSRDCTFTYDCWHIYAVVAHNAKSRSLLHVLWDSGSLDANCSNFRHCDVTRGGLELKHQQVGDQYSCYYDPSQPSVVYLNPPSSPLPYLIGSCLVATAAMCVTVCICYGRYRKWSCEQHARASRETTV